MKGTRKRVSKGIIGESLVGQVNDGRKGGSTLAIVRNPDESL